MLPRWWDQHRELLQQLERLEEEVGGAVGQRVLELVGETPVSCSREPGEGEGRAKAVAAEAFERPE